MIQLPIFARARFTALLADAVSAVGLSRILLLLVAVEMITMPITQGVWAWDRFLHGGQDFELGLLIIVTCLCFVLLRVQQNRSGFVGLVVIGAILSGRKHISANLLDCAASFHHRCQIPSPPPATAIDLPLLI